MLRIRVDEHRTERKIVLEGELIEPWVSELRSIWEAKGCTLPTQKYIVDLNEVTRIDEGGEALLVRMKQEGANLFATSVFMKHLIKSLKNKHDAE